jgi:subtilisin-like proprotein convertase family protein
MRPRGSRLARSGTTVFALVAIAALTAGTAQAKKTGKVGGTIDITRTVNAPIPDATTTTNGLLVSTIDISGKRFKGTRVRDVNVTLQTTGAAADSARDLEARVSAPDQSTSWLLSDLSGQSVGPLTLDDQTITFLDGSPPSPSPFALVSPYVGTAQPDCVELHGGCPLGVMNDHPASGTWTFRIYDNSMAAGRTSILNFWRLHIVTGKPYRTK